MPVQHQPSRPVNSAHRLLLTSLPVLLLASVSSCEKSEDDGAPAEPPTAASNPAPGSAGAPASAAPPAKPEPAVPDSPAVSSPPPVAAEENDARASSGASTPQQKLEAQSYYNDENVAAARALIEKVPAETRQAILDNMGQKKKVNAVKLIREVDKTSLAVSKLAVEMIAIAEGVDPGIL